MYTCRMARTLRLYYRWLIVSSTYKCRSNKAKRLCSNLHNYPR